MPTITATPNPVSGTRVDVIGTGFATKYWVSLVLNGMGTTTKVGVKRDGTFSVGFPIYSTLVDGSYKLEARKAGSTTVLAYTTVVVKRTVPPPPPVTSSRPIYGYGAQVTGGTDKEIVHVTTLANSGPGSLAYFMYNKAADKHIVFDVEGTLHLSTKIDCRGSNLTIDGASAPGKGITLTGETVQVAYGARNLIFNDIRHRGFGTTASQEGDCLSFSSDTKGILITRCSLSGANDETIDHWNNVHDSTIQDCIIGPHQPASMEHNFAVLFGAKSDRISFHHNLIFGSKYRNPAVGWDDSDAGEVSPGIVAEVIENLIWDYTAYGISVYWGAGANVEGNYVQGRTSNVMELAVSTGARAFINNNYSREGYTFPASNASKFVVPTYAAIAREGTPRAAAESILAKAGCRVGGLDEYDQNIINIILAKGL